MLKTFIKLIFQKTLGFSNYLLLFSLFIIKKLKWDKNERDFLHFLNLLPEEGIVLDIGANIGVMSYYLARGHEKRIVHAFEPIPFNYQNAEKIKKRFNLNNLFLHLLALGDKEDTIEMILPVHNSVRFHGLAHVRSDFTPEGEKGELFHCPIRRLDDFEPLKETCSRITGIKMDVENYEYNVLKGATELIRKHKPVIYCELWDNDNRRHSMELLTELGYRTLVLESGKLVNYIPERHSTQNFFFLSSMSGII
jgi:FkbM family methyltransferase